MAIDNRISMKNRFSRISASSFVVPQKGDLLAWYKIHEGSGSIVHNYADPGIYKFPDLDITAGLSTFWIRENDNNFGWWDGNITKVFKNFSFSMSPFGGLNKPITTIFFGRHDTHPINDTWSWSLQMKPGRGLWSSIFWRMYTNAYRFNGGMTSTTEAQIQFIPAPTYQNRNFFAVIRNPGGAGAKTELKVKWFQPYTNFTNVLATATGAGDPISSFNVGFDSVTPTTEEVWKGILGDIFIWKVYLNNFDIDLVFEYLKGLWNF